MRRSRRLEMVVGLFPGCRAAGGVQASGRLAWSALAGATSSFGTAARLCYGDRAAPSPHELHTSSRLAAVSGALQLRGNADLILVWHVDMLKLVPFVAGRASKVIAFLHGVECWRRLSGLENRLLDRVELFLSNSDFTWRQFLRFNPTRAHAPHRTVWLGIDEPAEAVPPPDSGAPVALMVSRLARSEDYKGHREVLDAWRLVLEQRPDSELWIAGDGDLRPELERIASERALCGSVRFLGRISEERKREVIARSRCMVLPSRGEGFGLVYVEAMRLGRPCLVSTLDAGREVVEPPRHGLAVDPSDRSALADALGRLLGDGAEWQAWSHHARERYAQQFCGTHFQHRLTNALAGLED